jgi:photosystem II stability/assembly factor-like uncharacterized protein
VAASADGGQSFALSNRGISELPLYAVAVDAADPRRLALAFQGNNNGGVFYSTDGGANWNAEDVPGTRYSAVAFAPDGTLYAISSGPSSVAPEGLYRRNPDGSWTGLGPDQGTLFESDLDAIRFSRNDPDLIFLGGADFGVAGFEDTVWRSSDAGANWTKVLEDTPNYKVTDIEIVEDGTDQTILAAFDDQTGTNLSGVERSTDGGTTWAPSNTGLPAALRTPHLCASPTTPQTLFASISLNPGGGVFRSDDGGASWTATGWTTNQTLYDIACSPVEDEVLYVAAFGATPVSRSDDQGATFAPYSNGLEAAGVPTGLAIADDGSDEALVALSTLKGSYATAVAPIANDAIFANGFE